jgi:hypothetical protein
MKKPICPTKPFYLGALLPFSKIADNYKFNRIFHKEEKIYINGITVLELLKKLEKYKENGDEYQIDISQEYLDYDNYCSADEIYISRIEVVPNPNFEKIKKDYEKMEAEDKEKHSKYKKEMKKYKIDMENYELEMLKYLEWKTGSKNK